MFTRRGQARRVRRELSLPRFAADPYTAKRRALGSPTPKCLDHLNICTNQRANSSDRVGRATLKRSMKNPDLKYLVPQSSKYDGRNDGT